MNFCSSCGEDVARKIPDGDNRERYVCDSCGIIHYQNPRIVTGCLPIWEDQVLLCLRAIEPRKGYWTLPAGFLENGETIVSGAMRETLEEAHARVENPQLYTVFSLPHISQVYMFYRVELSDLDFHSGTESLDVRLFKESDIPWDNLAFPVISQTLNFYFEDRLAQNFKVREREINIPRRPRRN